MEELPPCIIAAPRPVLALLRRDEQHGPLGEALETLGMRVLPIGEAEAADFPPEAKARRPPSFYEEYRPAGMLKTNWMTKHTTSRPAVIAVLFEWEEDFNWKNVEATVGSVVDVIKYNNRHRNVKVLLVRMVSKEKAAADEKEEKDRLHSLRRRTDLDSGSVMAADARGEGGAAAAAKRVHSAALELSTAYYREEARRTKKLRQTLNKSSQAGLYTRHTFKMGFLAEFRQDWSGAFKYYLQGYEHLVESLAHFSSAQVVEVKTVAEILNYKMCSIQLQHFGNRSGSVEHFRRHIDRFKRMLGKQEPETAFEHWAFVARQYRICGELLDKASDAGKDSQDRWLGAGLYFHAAARNTQRRLQAANSCALPEGAAAAPADATRPEWGGYYGQYQLQQGASDDPLDGDVTAAAGTIQLLAWEKQCDHSKLIVEMLAKANEQFKLRALTRMEFQLLSEMASEHFSSGDFVQAKNLLDQVIGKYRQERWYLILGSALQKLLHCCQQLDHGAEFVSCSFELMAAELGLPKEKRLEVQANAWAVLHLPPPESAEGAEVGPFQPSLEGEQIAKLALREALTIPIAHHPLFKLEVKFRNSSVAVSQQLGFELHVTVASMTAIRFSALRLCFSEADYNVTITDGAQSDSHELSRTADLLCLPGRKRVFEFTALAATVGTVSCTEISAGLVPTEGPEITLLKEGGVSVGVTPPKAKATLRVDHSPPALLQEFYRVDATFESQEDIILKGVIGIKVTQSDGTAAEILTLERAPLTEPLSFAELATDGSHAISFLVQCKVLGPMEVRVTSAYDTDSHSKTVELERIAIQCEQPFSPTFTFLSSEAGTRAASGSAPLEPPLALLKDAPFTLQAALSAQTKHDVRVWAVALEPAVEGEQLQQGSFSALDLAKGDTASVCSRLRPTRLGGAVSLGSLRVTWGRAGQGQEAAEAQALQYALPAVGVESDTLTARQVYPHVALLGEPINVSLYLKNHRDRLEHISLRVEDKEQFCFSGLADSQCSLLPQQELTLRYCMVPLDSGKQRLPAIVLEVGGARVLLSGPAPHVLVR